jgi:S1-C subfamily serine protease
MKTRTFGFIFLLLIIGAYAQNLDTLSGYKYVYIGTLQYQNGAKDVWGICSRIGNFFSSMGFIVLTENSTPPQELTNDPCLLLRCDIEHTGKQIGTNSVTITLVNCKNEVVFKNKGTYMGGSLRSDYNGATKRALEKLSKIKYTFDPSLTPVPDLPEVEKTNETEESLKSYLTANKLDSIEGLYNSRLAGTMNFYRFAIVSRDDKFKAIIIESGPKSWKPGEVKAVFEPTSIQGLYAVKWYMQDKSRVDTFAKMENAALLSIEVTNASTKEKTQDYFIKMFPPVSGDPSIRPEGVSVSGSGFFVSTNGIIATNAHVIEGANSIEVSISNEVGNFVYKAKVLLADNKNDVALIKIDDEKFKSLSSIPYGFIDKADAGEKVFTIGFPMNDIMGSNYKVTDGIISAQSGIADDIRYFQITVPVQPGNSGGPLFNKAGNVIGLTTAKLNSKAVGTDVENVNYAIKASYLMTLYNMLPNVEKLGDASKIANKALEDQVKVLKNYVCLINAK